MDKIAFFINSYFDLGIKEHDVSYRNIWRAEKSGKNGYKYRTTLDISANYPLKAIYWICKDFYDVLDEAPNPAAKELSNLRNSLEHKYVKVFLDDFLVTPGDSVDDLATYISEARLNELTMQLIRDIREALINVSLAVHVEEQRKKAALHETTFIPEIALMGYDDEWKI